MRSHDDHINAFNALLSQEAVAFPAWASLAPMLPVVHHPQRMQLQPPIIIVAIRDRLCWRRYSSTRIRMPDGDVGDQKRVATPAFAVEQGSTHLVVGRPIVQATDPAEATSAILADIKNAR